MVKLKTKIQIANVPVFEKIYRLSELKNIASKLKYLSCDAERRELSGGKLSTPVINTNKRDTLLDEIQKQIEKIQEELDEFNYQTKI